MEGEGAIRQGFDEKLRAACQRATERNLTNSLLHREVGVSHDTWAKWKRGTQPSTPNLRRIIATFEAEIGLEPQVWCLPASAFRAQLEPGGDEGEVGLVPSSQVEFRCRERQPELLLEQLQGFWVTFYYSASVADRLVISRDLVEVGSTHRNGYVACRVLDSHFDYRGFCFTYGGGLVQWLLEKEDLHNEVLSYMTTRPDRTPPVLLGLMLCTSGGVSSVAQLPAAARVAMVRLGPIDRLVGALGLESGDVRRVLERIVPCYLTPGDVPPWIDAAISNVIDPSSRPSSLVVQDGAGPTRAERGEVIDRVFDELRNAAAS